MSREISRIEQQWKDWNSLTGVEVLLHWVTFTAVNFLELEIAFLKNRYNIYFDYIMKAQMSS